MDGSSRLDPAARTQVAKFLQLQPSTKPTASVPEKLKNLKEKTN
jgi:hypothetical protein